MGDGGLPHSWMTGNIEPIQKKREPLSSLSFFRAISLTSCVGKLFETMIHRRLMCLVERHKIFPESMSGSRWQRCIADGIAELASSPEEARRMDRTVHVAFLDIHRAFDALSHNIILQRIVRSDVCGKALGDSNPYSGARLSALILAPL